VRLLNDEKVTNEQSYAKSISTVQSERNKILNDYQASCYEYQKLRTSYNFLYDKMGASSGLGKYSSPDDVRGNDESCYR
jgi:hypothetical protein